MTKFVHVYIADEIIRTASTMLCVQNEIDEWNCFYL